MALFIEVSVNPARWRYNWQRLKHAYPESKIHAGAVWVEDQARNCRIWKEEHPESRIDPDPISISEWRRNWQILREEVGA